ncbi:MAG TPA: PKD domain containing protein, partial [Nocardioidaceae bacterium]|nr:PKD domain containing protein [Nocardioidaceae bacterium]
PPPPEPSEVSFVAASNRNVYGRNHSVQVPTTVQEGDTLLLFFTANQNPASTTAPPGWSQLQATDPAGIRGRVWTRTATAADAQTTLTVTNSASSKADLTLAAYRGTAEQPIDVHGLAVDTGSTATHLAPSVTPSQPGDWVLVYWADKSSANTGFTIPAQLTRRSSATGIAGGHLTSALADTNTSVPIAPTGTFTATGTAVAGKAVMYTIAIGSAEVTPPPIVVP